MHNNFALERLNMVRNQVMVNKVFDSKIAEAMLEVPRHDFVPTHLNTIAYLDRSINISKERVLLKPEVFGQMLEWLHITDRSNVLDIGCGSGYSTAVISRLCNHVVGVESIKELAVKAANLLPKMNYNNTSIKHAPLMLGAAEEAPFDIVLFNGCIEYVPNSILAQLKKGSKVAYLAKNNSNICNIFVCECINIELHIIKVLDGHGEQL